MLLLLHKTVEQSFIFFPAFTLMSVLYDKTCEIYDMIYNISFDNLGETYNKLIKYIKDPYYKDSIYNIILKILDKKTYEKQHLYLYFKLLNENVINIMSKDILFYILFNHSFIYKVVSEEREQQIKDIKDYYINDIKEGDKFIISDEKEELLSITFNYVYKNESNIKIFIDKVELEDKTYLSLVFKHPYYKISINENSIKRNILNDNIKIYQKFVDIRRIQTNIYKLNVNYYELMKNDDIDKFAIYYNETDGDKQFSLLLMKSIEYKAINIRNFLIANFSEIGKDNKEYFSELITEIGDFETLEYFESMDLINYETILTKSIETHNKEFFNYVLMCYSIDNENTYEKLLFDSITYYNIYSFNQLINIKDFLNIDDIIIKLQNDNTINKDTFYMSIMFRLSKDHEEREYIIRKLIKEIINSFKFKDFIYNDEMINLIKENFKDLEELYNLYRNILIKYFSENININLSGLKQLIKNIYDTDDMNTVYLQPLNVVSLWIFKLSLNTYYIHKDINIITYLYDHSQERYYKRELLFFIKETNYEEIRNLINNL